MYLSLRIFQLSIGYKYYTNNNRIIHQSSLLVNNKYEVY